ncbi:MAG: alanine racemase [Christensenellales bacterium]
MTSAAGSAHARRARSCRSIGLCYSIKANPFLISAMRGLVGTLEVCSPGELEICRQMGVPADMVLFSGVNKTKADVERAMDLGVTHFTCESPLHIRLIDEAARARGRVYPVLLRLTAGSQFGMDERDFFAALDRRADTPNIRIEASYFSGTQRKNSTASAKSWRCWPNWPR